MALDEYLARAQQRLGQVRTALPQWRFLIPPLDDLYEGTMLAVPQGVEPAYGEGVLLCHRSMLVTACLAGQGHVDDALSCARTAIEIARVARALKHDPENFDEWLGAKARFDRFEVREKGGRPPRAYTPRLRYPSDHPALEWLGLMFGVISDTHAHFTPGYVWGAAWGAEDDPKAGRILMSYFGDQRAVEHALVLLTRIHLCLLDLFDECFDSALKANEVWAAKRSTLGQVCETFRRAEESVLDKADRDTPDTEETPPANGGSAQ